MDDIVRRLVRHRVWSAPLSQRVQKFPNSIPLPRSHHYSPKPIGGKPAAPDAQVKGPDMAYHKFLEMLPGVVQIARCE